MNSERPSLILVTDWSEEWLQFSHHDHSCDILTDNVNSDSVLFCSNKLNGSQIYFIVIYLCELQKVSSGDFKMILIFL